MLLALSDQAVEPRQMLELVVDELVLGVHMLPGVYLGLVACMSEEVVVIHLSICSFPWWIRA
jgi:hypothetical protein